MKLLFRGGLNKRDPDGWKKSYLYEYTGAINKLIGIGKKVSFVTMAKPDHYYDQYIVPQFGNSVDIIGNGIEDVDWNMYDLIFLCGGDTVPLKEGLLKKKFNFDIIEGIYPETQTIVIVHVNNPKYCSGVLIRKVGDFAKEKGFNVLKLKENETKLFDEQNGKFVDFKFEELFDKD